MTIKIRLSGEADDIAHLVEHLRTEFDVAGADRAYPNRGSFGVRVYLELRDRTSTTARHVSSQRLHPDTPNRKGLQP